MSGGDNGDFGGFFGSTDLKAIKENAYNILDKLWTHSLLSIALVQKDGTFINANKAFCELIEYAEIELKAKNFADIAHPDERLFCQMLAQQLVENKKNSYAIFKKVITKTNKVLMVRLQVQAVREGSEFLFFVCQMFLVDQRHFKKMDSKEVDAPSEPALKIKKLPAKWGAFIVAAAYFITELLSQLKQAGIFTF